MNLRQGALLQGGKYRIERELGHGGFGITYLAVQTGLNRRVAIKEFFMAEYCNRDAETSHVSVPSEGSKELVARFRNKFVKEAQNIACLKHPHIIGIHDVFEENGTAYYVMEYLDHGSLADLVKQRGRLPEADALRYTRQIADALSYIHARKMNHLDVKPGNILVDEADGAVLIDFGLSKRYDDEGNQTSTTPVGISHGYAPLEQYKKSGVGTFSPATDIYSLGATLYKLVTGSTPPDANDVSEDGLPPFPSSVSAAVAAAVEQAMQPRRKDRPQSVEAFLSLLDAEVDEDTVIEVGAPSISPRGGRTPGIAEHVAANRQTEKNCPSSRGTSVESKASERRGSASSTLKKYLLPTLACVVVALAIVFWPKGGDAPAPPAPVKPDTPVVVPPVKPADNVTAQTNQQQTSQQASQQQQPPRQATQQTSQQQSQPAPAKEEPAVPTTTPLYVTTTPSGVTVYVDGKKVGTTPVEGKEIARGSHKVKLGKEGYQDKTFTRTFGDKPVVINETLAETPKPQAPAQTASTSTTSGSKKTYTVNGVSFTMVRVAGGTFTMGASSSDSDAYSDEKPAHQVTLSNYSIGETEVTQALWQAVMGSNPSSFTGNLQRPVETVSWNDCQEFIGKLNSLTGGTFRLPTEAEWEYAARGGNRSIGYKYSGGDNLGSVAWYDGNSSSTTHPVKGKQPNELGLYDMSGNVWEWCADWFDSSYYASSPQNNPKGPSAGSDRVIRGGSWGSIARSCRVSYRISYAPSSTYSHLGLRLVSQ